MSLFARQRPGSSVSDTAAKESIDMEKLKQVRLYTIANVWMNYWWGTMIPYFPCAETDFALLQEILEEMRKELQKVKEEIIGGQFMKAEQLLLVI